MSGRLERKSQIPIALHVTEQIDGVGDWFDFWTHDRYSGGARYTITADVDTVPLRVRGGTALPLAEPGPYVLANTTIEVRAFGPDAPDPVVIYADDGVAEPALTEIQPRRDETSPRLASWTEIR